MNLRSLGRVPVALATGAVVLSTAGIAVAKTTTVSPTTLAGGSAAVSGCDVSSHWSIPASNFTEDSSGNITGVTVAGIAGCAAGDVVGVALRLGSSVKATGTGTVSGSTASITNLTANPAYNQVDHVDVVIIGS